MRIAIVDSTFTPDYVNGGTCAVTKELTSVLVKENEVLIIALGHTKNILTINNFYTLTILPSDKKHKMKQSIRGLLCKFVPEVILINTANYLGEVCVSYGKRWQIPTLYCHHSRMHYAIRLNTSNKIDIFKRERVIKQIIKKSDCLICVSESSKMDLLEFLQKKDNDRIHIVRNGCNMNSLSALDVCYGGGRFKLLYVGRIARQKNIEQSLQIIKELVKRKLNVNFNVVGDSDYENELREEAKKMNINKNVHFLGYKDFDELMRLYAQSDCLLFPSIFDTDGLVVKEANKCGCPALVIENTGASEQIENNINGFALPNDVIAFADKIEELYRLKKTNKEEYLALRERTLNKKVPSWEEVAKEYIDLFQKAIVEKSQS